MKTHYCLALVSTLLGQALAQSPAPPRDVTVTTETEIAPAAEPGSVTTVEKTVTPGPIPGTVTETVVEETVTPGLSRRLDPALARRQLSILPRPVPVVPPVGAPPVVVDPATGAIVPPGAKVETTETKTIVKQPGLPPRVYNIERSVVLVEGRELPYLTLPVLFVKETAELLDSDSRLAIQETAAAIMEVLKTTPDATFDIEGHTSTDGEAEMNLELSALRAQRVYDELTKNYAVPPAVLVAHGHGENYPAYPSGTEEQMTLDRRVLVVRIR